MYERVRRAVLLATILAVLAAAAASAEPSYVIVRDVSIGGFRRDGTVASAIAVFGQPTSREQGRYDTCTLTWRDLGLTMETYYTNAQLDPCGPEGRHRRTTITSRRWRTSAGLRVGDSLRRLRGLYRRARRGGDGTWWLIRRSLAGFAFPGLAASVSNGRVVSLIVYGPRTGF
jgi:hypothetical protein